MPNHFAQNLKALRQKAGKTQSQVADELIINRPTLGAWEEGRSEPAYDKLIAIAGYYKVTTDQLLKEKL